MKIREFSSYRVHFIKHSRLRHDRNHCGMTAGVDFYIHSTDSFASDFEIQIIRAHQIRISMNFSIFQTIDGQAPVRIDI